MGIGGADVTSEPSAAVPLQMVAALVEIVAVGFGWVDHARKGLVITVCGEDCIELYMLLGCLGV